MSVYLDFGVEDVEVNGADARAEVTFSSDFFPLGLGDCELTFSGCSSHMTAFHNSLLDTASLIIRYEVPSQDAQPYREGERLRR